jgi:hypothetical protein
VGQLEPAEHSQSVAVPVASEVVDQRAAIPPVAEHRADRVLALLHDVGHVERVVAELVVVAVPARREHVVADASTVQLELVHTERGHVQARARHGRRHRERTPEVRARLGRLEILLPGRAHERRLPVGLVEQAGLDGERLAPRRFRTVGPDHPDPDRAALSGLQRRCGPRHEHRFARVDDAGRELTVVCTADPQLVSRLHPAWDVGLGAPRETRRGHPDAEWLEPVFDGDAGDSGRGHQTPRDRRAA